MLKRMNRRRECVEVEHCFEPDVETNHNKPEYFSGKNKREELAITLDYYKIQPSVKHKAVNLLQSLIGQLLMKSVLTMTEMSTGDLKACLRKLEAALRSLKYPREVDYQRLAVGDPSACLPIVSFAFTSFSPSLTEHLVDYGMELTGMNDLRFIENVYKVLREVFSYKPLLTKQQFLQFGFAERKVIILSDIIGLVLNKHKELTKDSKHVSKVTRRPQFKSCSKNEIPSAESNSLGLTALTVPQKQPLVERHLGSSSVPAQIRCSSEEQPQQEEETEKDSSQPADSIECVLESRLRGVEAGLLESVGRLEQRLALMEHRIHALEKSFAGKIIIESNQWENMESRVLLLETRLALTSAQGLTSGDDVLSTDNGRFKEDTVSASGISTVIQPPSAISNNGHTPASSPPTAHQNFKERLDRIVYMMEHTSNILQNRTDDVNLITVQRNVF